MKRTEILRAVQARRVPRGLGRGWLGAVLCQERLLRVGERLAQRRKDRELFMDRVSAPHELTHHGLRIPAVLTSFDEHSALYVDWNGQGVCLQISPSRPEKPIPFPDKDLCKLWANGVSRV